ncbi:hypothetical protein WDW86_15025 [Bdellovibrionota bacterium FG-2]
MSPLRIKLLLSLALAVFGGSGVAVAVEIDQHPSAAVPCAVLEKFGGKIEIMDSTRTHLVDAVMRAGVPCGGWVSVGKGWAEFRHRDGFHVSLSDQTFVQFLESNIDGKESGDHVVLYKGQVYAKAGSGTGEFRAVTSSSRARLTRGAILLLADSSSEALGDETQLVALENVARLENRFESSKQIDVSSGEASSINFKLLRVVPTAPKVVAITELRPRLGSFHLEEREQGKFLRIAQKRQDRKLASVSGLGGDVIKSRAPASVPSNKSPARAAKGFMSGSVIGDEETMLKTHLERKLAGGEAIGEEILHPDTYHGREQKAGVVVDAGIEKKKKFTKAEDQEKKKLIEELSQIKEY